MHGDRRGFLGAASLLALVAAPAAAQQLPQTSTAAEGEPDARSKLSIARPRSPAELSTLLQTVAVLDPATDVTADRTIEVVQRISASRPWGVIANGAKIRPRLHDGT